MVDVLRLLLLLAQPSVADEALVLPGRPDDEADEIGGETEAEAAEAAEVAERRGIRVGDARAAVDVAAAVVVVPRCKVPGRSRWGGPGHRRGIWLNLSGLSSPGTAETRWRLYELEGEWTYSSVAVDATLALGEGMDGMDGIGGMEGGPVGATAGRAAWTDWESRTRSCSSGMA